MSRITSFSRGLSSLGHLVRRAPSSAWGEAGSPRAASQEAIAGRGSSAKYRGTCQMWDASLSERARRPDLSKVGWRGPPPSVMRRWRSGSSLRAADP